MDWNDVRYFLAVHRHGTVSAAGKAIGVNHTTVSRRIAALEAQLATRLFDRTAEGYQLTPSGEAMLDAATRMEETANAIDRQAAGRDAELSGRLVVTMPYDFANRVVVPGFGAFLAQYPGINVELNTSLSLADLSAREADLAIRLTDKPPEYLVGRKLMPVTHGIYVLPDYWEQHRDNPSLVTFPGSGLPDWAADLFPKSRVVFRTTSVNTLLSAVEAGLGMARLPCFVGDTSSVARRLDVRLPASTWGVWSLNHVDLRSTARVRVCREFLQNLITEKRSLIEGANSRYIDPVV